MRAIAAFVSLVLVSACQAPPPPEMTDADRQTIAEELRQLSLLLNEFGAENDMDGILQLWVEDPGAYFVGEQAVFLQSVRLLPTKDAMMEFFTPMQTSRGGTRFTVLNDYVAVLSSDLAIQVLEQKYSVIDTLGIAGPEYPESATTVWVREGVDWKILHFHQSWSDEPIE